MTTTNGKAETIVKNANIMTMNTRKPRAQSLAIAHGRFLGVGSNEDVEGLIGPGTQIVDAVGKTVLPGFIDGHSCSKGTGRKDACWRMGARIQI